MALLKKPEKNEKEKALTADQAAEKKNTDKKVPVKAETKKVVSVKQDRESSLSRVKSYFKGVVSEIKKVHWPTRKEVLIYTAVVAVAVIIVSTLIWVFDSAMSRLMQLIIR